MIACLPSSPGEGLGQADRLDDLPDLALVDRALEGRLGQEAVADELLGDRRAAPRLPLSVSSAAEMMPAGSKPAFSQKVLSSMAVVASTISGGISVEGDDVAPLAGERASCTLPVRS